MKKKILSMGIAVSLCVACIVSGCGSKQGTTEKKETAKEYSEEDLQDVMVCLTDRYVLQNAQDIDYLFDIGYDEEIVTELTVDDSKVTVETVGTYDIVYTATVDVEKLEEFRELLDGELDLELAVEEESEESAAGRETKTVKIVKTVEVVDEKTAERLIESGEIVWTTGNEQLHR